MTMITNPQKKKHNQATQKEMSVMDHAAELRRRILVILSFFVVALIGGFFLAVPLIQLLQEAPQVQEMSLNAFRLTDSLWVFVNFAVITAVILIIPVILYQLWAFVSPGLKESERKATLAYIPIAFFLFLGGIAFAYFVLLPFVIGFMSTMASRLDIEEMYGISEYFSFLFQLTLPFGALFQLPVIVMFLTRLGVVTPALLRKIRKYAYFVLLVIGALITPPDLLSHLLVTVPMLILYEVSIVISTATYKKYQSK
ncbi:twin-arginine translocase subunit TatC [Shouchella lonarensis]|uniref:Sec-independent protein translocase protein TatC n=1 Tax=Shouchella lonarensis TaxID=1464122 RepID=A0A1G6HXU7_9BACI|nr:twin-arginine translocase subunit TatC [Shouchella lonarensis]SDB99147.1 sec-independent protein translocase protein TatC [Shouchella lonarensis]